jgi:hypothetical protein
MNTTNDIIRDDRPIIKYNGDYIKKPLSLYYPSSQCCKTTYGNAIGKKLLWKVMHDNNIQCQSTKHTLIYYDIETYNE